MKKQQVPVILSCLTFSLVLVGVLSLGVFGSRRGGRQSAWIHSKLSARG